MIVIPQIDLDAIGSLSDTKPDVSTILIPLGRSLEHSIDVCEITLTKSDTLLERFFPDDIVEIL